jgi:hypothetical protein
VVKSRIVATPRRPIGSQENNFEPRVPLEHPPPGCTGGQGLEDLAVMGYPSPVDPDSPRIQSHHAGGSCVVDGVDIIEVVVARSNGGRSSI